ncbi:reverse transcriptase domain-containing protein [Tanacetum coccineum]
MLIARKRVHPFPARIPANYRRSRYVSSSSSPSPQKRRKVSPHSSSSASPSSSSFDAPSRKRGRSPTTSLSAADRSPAALSPARADLLPHRKRLMGSSSAFHQENSIKDSTDIGTKVGVKVSVGPTIKIDVDVIAELDIPHVLSEQTMEERLEEHEEVEEEIRTLTSRLETTKAERTALRDRVRSLEISEMSLRGTLRFERERFIGVQRHLGYVSAELRRSRMSRFADKESFRMIETFMIRIMPATRSGMTPEAIEENEGDNKNGNGGRNGNGHGNGNGGGSGNGNRGGNINWNGNNNNRNGNHGDNAGGVMQAALRTDAAYAMTWKELMKLMTEVYCLRNEMVPKEEDKVERYIWGLPDSIQWNVTSFAPTRLQDAVRMASSLMDQKVRANAARQADSKRNNEKKPYFGNLPYCNKCKLHHTGPCTVKCGNCKKVGHMMRDFKTLAATTNQRAPLANQKTTVTCYECGKQGHYRSDCQS